ncbi:MAG TPA: efflux RND transporter periplasmic adaptor subunit [Candidatus Sulfomarinibacteraceae bacterium]|nr:efflux RND transporter periplasmic adaptor subunit [Candidatus Sulfomarinibacteraceae bacterium]
MKRDTLLTAAVGAAILIAAAALTAWPDAPAEPEAPGPHPRTVRVAEVADSTAGNTVRLAGVTRAVRRAELAFTVPARLASRPVEIGDRVAAGQALASLDDHEYRLAADAASAALAELEVRLAQAERDLDRVARLADARAATTEELEQTRAATAALTAARDAARARLEETRRLCREAELRAPFAGTVTGVAAEPGEWVEPGRTVVELAGDGAVEVLVEAPESVRSRIAIGSDVRVELPFTGFIAAGRVTRAAAAAAGPGRLFPVEVELEADARLVPGLAAEVVIPLEGEPELTVPLQAVVNPGAASPSVFRVSGGRAEEVAVGLGRIHGDRIAVTAELAAEDLVAVTGHAALTTGDAVEVVR